MNYTITINQYAGEIHFPELDIIDLAIFDYISRFYASADKFNDISGIWIWISHKKIIQDMPKLKINSKAGIIRRINNLVDCEILERHPESQQLSKSYYRIGKNWGLLTKIDPSQSKSTGAINENQEAPLDENQDNPNTNINPNTNDTICLEFVHVFNESTGKKIRVLDNKSKKQLLARLKEGFKIEEIIQAAKNCSTDPYHIENKHYLTPEFITRSDKLQKYLNYETHNGKPQSITSQKLQADSKKEFKTDW
jgi:uncharacterized phage protein (TIGR02220 family)